MKELKDFAAICSAVEDLLYDPKTDRNEEKNLSLSGNEAVFRGSFQLLRLILPGRVKTAGCGHDLNFSQRQLSSAGQSQTV
jgi:hypothetical protein